MQERKVAKVRTMSTAVFDLFGRLAAAATVNQIGIPSALTMGPPQMLLPTDEECVEYGHKRPIVFFYEPRMGQQHTNGAVECSAGGCSTGAAFTSSNRTSFLQGWPAEMSEAQLSAPETSVEALRVTNAEDDLDARLSTQEVWADWPKTIRGWQLCPVNHLCAVLHTNAVPPKVYLLASRYELVGTSAVYERYLLLTNNSKGSRRGGVADAVAGATAATASASISVTELRTLRRVACLCRCFCTSARLEVLPRRSVAPIGSGSETCDPPPPLADHVFRMVPTSLQYTFCFAATALLSAADEDRSQSWTATTTALSRKRFSSGPQLCSITEAANTSGALSDVGHTTYFESVSQSRDRSISTVRVVEGGCGGATNASVVGLSDDPRSAASTPAQGSLAMTRIDEQHEALSEGRHHEDLQQGENKGTSEEALPPSQQWRAMALRRLLDRSFYDEQVPAGWGRWRYASKGTLSRSLAVDSLDGIVFYIGGSRLAFYTAVAFLDRFVAVAVDPLANIAAYKRQSDRFRMQREMDCSMPGMPGSRPTTDPLSAPELGTQQLYATEGDSSVQERDTSNFLTQVILVCIMLGSKTVDLYPPRIRSLISCTGEANSMSEEEFVILEFHILLTLGFPVNPVTLFEAAGTLLTFTTSDALYGTLMASHTTRRLLEEHEDHGHLLVDVNQLIEEEAEDEEAAAVAGCAQPPLTPLAAALPLADRHVINDWLRLRLFAYFICDEAIRADTTYYRPSSSDASSSSSGSITPRQDSGADSRIVEEEAHGSGRGISILQISPVLVAAAALVIAAEQLCLSLPAPLLRLLPDVMQAHLRDLPAEEGTGVGIRKKSENVSGHDMAAPQRRGPHASQCNVAMEEPGVASRRNGSAARRSEICSGLRLTAGVTDDHYKVLMELSRMLEQELSRLSDDRDNLLGALVQSSVAASSPRSVSPQTAPRGKDQHGVSSGGAAAVVRSSPPTLPYTMAMPRGGTARRGASSSSSVSGLMRPASPRVTAMFGCIIEEIKCLRYRNRERCPKVLMERYHSLFRNGA